MWDEAKYLSAKTLETVSKALFLLIQRFRANKKITAINTFGVLLGVLKDQCQIPELDFHSNQARRPPFARNISGLRGGGL